MTADMLAAVYAAPDDDRPRRVYADWLIERGDPRGEFIQHQCAGLAVKHRPEWEPRLDAAGPFEWTFRRGFPFRVEARASQLVAVEGVPTVREVVAHRFDVTAERWLGAALLPQLEGAWLHYLPQTPGASREALIDAVLGDARMQHLTRFGISYTYLTEVEFRAVAHAPLIPRLEALDLGLANVTNAGLAALVPRATRLTRLNAANSRVGTLGCEVIAAAPGALEHLDVSWNRVGVKGARALAGLAALKSLNLSHNQIGDAGCAAIAAGLPALTALRVEQCRITEQGARLLAEKKGLRALELTGNGLSDEVLRDCAQRLAGSRPA